MTIASSGISLKIITKRIKSEAFLPHKYSGQTIHQNKRSDLRPLGRDDNALCSIINLRAHIRCGNCAGWTDILQKGH